MQINLRFICLFFMTILLFKPSFSSQILSGTVKDGAGAGVEGAAVQLVLANKSNEGDPLPPHDDLPRIEDQTCPA
jgi:hypothetical protein